MVNAPSVTSSVVEADSAAVKTFVEIVDATRDTVVSSDVLRD